MEKSTFASCSNYFDRLRGKTRNIDEGIARLSETWKTPQLLIGGYAERTTETNVYLEGLWESIRNTGVNTIRLILSRSLRSPILLCDHFLCNSTFFLVLFYSLSGSLVPDCVFQRIFESKKFEKIFVLFQHSRIQFKMI